jgi:hypothetical protein
VEQIFAASERKSPLNDMDQSFCAKAIAVAMAG